jgi:hypothetical protein
MQNQASLNQTDELVYELTQVKARLAVVEGMLAHQAHQRPSPRPTSGPGYVAKARPVEGPECGECGKHMWWSNAAKKAAGKISPKAPAYNCATKGDDGYCPGRCWTEDDFSAEEPF